MAYGYRTALPATLALITAFAAILATGISNTSAQDSDTATITVHLRLCDEVVPDGNYYPTCHDNAYPDIEVYPSAGDVPEPAVTTDAEGNATFVVVPGMWSLGGPSGDAVEDMQIVCSPDDDPASPVQFPLTLEAGDAVTCDYYVVPAGADDAGAGTETPPPAPGDDSAPSDEAAWLTGIFAGTCADRGDALVAVVPIAPPSGETAGAADAVPADTARIEVDVPLDDLLADPHVVGVLLDGEDATALVACGPIGGVVADDGSLTIGLSSQEQYTDIGVAYLAPEEDGTAVTVFHLPGEWETGDA